MMLSWWELAIAVALDLAIGDPPWLPHPVRAIGWLIARGERIWRRTGVPARIAGIGLVLSVLGIAVAVVWATLVLLPRPLPQIYWAFSLLAIRDLDVQTSAVIAALRGGDADLARQRLARVVGRDTGSLDEPEIVRAACETMAENLSDGVVAPLLYLAAGGPMAMIAYKVVNTLDSMIGYRSERYLHFGWFAARLDDAANWIPARLTAALLWLAALLPGLRFTGAVRATFRDGGSQPSPNAGWPEAAMAGALGVRLGGVNFYGGVASNKPFLGDARRALDASIFPRARLAFYFSALAAVILAGVRL